MNSFAIRENKTLKEKYYYTTLDCGLRVTVIPKNLPNKFAFICSNFGGADIEYEHNGKRFELPAGTAHFLEHKMFECADGSDAFLEFDRFGGNANAYTSFENTCYYFSCTENFFENLDVLLRAVSSLHISKASVDKERKIIEREIKMYEDLPSSIVNRNLSRALYFAHPTIYPISGTVETIANIAKSTLEQAFEHFYAPTNLSLCVCGNIDPEEVKAFAEKYFQKTDFPRPKTLFPDEPKNVAQSEIATSAVVATPLYSIGIKCPAFENHDRESFRKATAMRLAISLTFGRASDFYCQNYEKGLLNERFYAGYTSSRQSAHIVISGSGSEYDRVFELVKAELEHRKKVFFSEEQLLREKKAAYAESITLFDSGEDLTSVAVSNAFFDFDEFDCIDILRDVTYDEVYDALHSIDLNNSSISIVKSNERKGTIQ